MKKQCLKYNAKLKRFTSSSSFTIASSVVVRDGASTKATVTVFNVDDNAPSTSVSEGFAAGAIIYDIIVVGTIEEETTTASPALGERTAGTTTTTLYVYVTVCMVIVAPSKDKKKKGAFHEAKQTWQRAEILN